MADYFLSNYGRCAFNLCPCLQERAECFNAHRTYSHVKGPGPQPRRYLGRRAYHQSAWGRFFDPQLEACGATTSQGCGSVIRATIAEPVEPTIESVFGPSFHVKHRRARQEWRLIPVGFRGAFRRVLVVWIPSYRTFLKERANG